MHILHDEIGIPKIVTKSTGGNSAVFTISPLPNGFGMTLGNALRRVLLSSVPGAAITAVRIDGASHEYTTIDGMKDSVLDLCLNLKQVRLQKHSKGTEIATLTKKGAGDITAKDIKLSSDIELLNADQIITTVDKKAGGLNLELQIEKGVGYLPAADQQAKAESGENWIYLDATFSPVLRVKYEVSATRVADNTDLDQVEIEVETNGSLSPEDAMKFSANVLHSYFDLFQKDQSELIEADFMATVSSAAGNGEEAPQAEDDSHQSYTPIEVLNLSPRTLNALINGDIGSIEELVKCSPAKLENLRGFGKKAMDEIAETLATRGLSLSTEE